MSRERRIERFIYEESYINRDLSAEVNDDNGQFIECRQTGQTNLERDVIFQEIETARVYHDKNDDACHNYGSFFSPKREISGEAQTNCIDWSKGKGENKDLFYNACSEEAGRLCRR